MENKDFEIEWYKNNVSSLYEKLPCGNLALPEDCGYRCQTCFTIYGSISCPCTRNKENKKENNNETI